MMNGAIPVRHLQHLPKSHGRWEIWLHVVASKDLVHDNGVLECMVWITGFRRHVLPYRYHNC